MKVIVKTPSRLHLGIIDPAGLHGRRYGSIGLTINEPSFEIEAEPSDNLKISCSKQYYSSVLEALNTVSNRYGVDRGVYVKILKGIPVHVGLGSTTQLKLGVATAYLVSKGLNVSVEKLAETLGRGEFSGIGTYAFARGGFIVDGGVKMGKQPKPIVSLNFPEDWKIIVVIPGVERGYDEEAEKPIMTEVRGDSSLIMEVAYLTLMKLIPGVVDRDIVEFGEALSSIQVLVGRAFSKYQGGVFRSGVVDGLVRRLKEVGGLGVGQSSWGPTVYAFTDSDIDCLRKAALKCLSDYGIEGSIIVTNARNRGADISRVIN